MQHEPDSWEDLHTTWVHNAPPALVSQDTGLYLRTEDHQVYGLQGGALLLGRDVRCHIALNSRLASRFHAAIYRKGSLHILRDLHSTNGITVNGVPLLQAILRPEDTFEVGGQRFSLMTGPAVPIAPAEAGIVVFVDLAGFTSLSERHGSAFSIYLQACMEALEDWLLILGGYPIKMMGDGLIGAFHLYPTESAALDFEQALRFARRAVALFSSYQRFGPLRLRVGLHYGPLTLIEHPSFDLVGDTVNTAARLESANTHYGTQILASDAFCAGLQAPQWMREVDRVRLKGRQRPITLYTFDPQYARYQSVHHRAPYLQGLAAYRQGDFESARGIWSLSVNHDPLCGPMLERLAVLDTAPASWDGVWDLDK